MKKDLGNWSIYINKSNLSNWAVGIDRYQEWDGTSPNYVIVANVYQINLLLFNVTITRWSRWT